MSTPIPLADTEMLRALALKIKLGTPYHVADLTVPSLADLGRMLEEAADEIDRRRAAAPAPPFEIVLTHEDGRWMAEVQLELAVRPEDAARHPPQHGRPVARRVVLPVRAVDGDVATILCKALVLKYLARELEEGRAIPPEVESLFKTRFA